MESVAPLKSITDLKGLYLYWGEDKIIVRARKESTPKKPLHFLFNLTKKKYISSLYLLEPEVWQFDFQGKIREQRLKLLGLR